MNELVLVGKFLPETKIDENTERAMGKERELLVDKLNEANIPNLRVPVKWPRDYFVLQNKEVLLKKDQGFYADGGYILNRPNFTMICAEVSRDWNGKELDSVEERTNKINNFYRNPHIFPAPDPSTADYVCPHIDLVLLPISEREILFVDDIYNNMHNKEIARFAEKHSLKIIEAKDSHERTWPCNTLIYSANSKLYAITAKDSPLSFKKDLNKYDIEVIEVPFRHNCSRGGSIHCATNLIPENLANNVYLEQIFKL